MHQHIAMNWADRLESGKYEQGTGALCHEAGMFCCLGVLSEMAVEAGIATKEKLSYSEAIRYTDVEPTTNYDGESYQDDSTGILTRNIMEWSGMQTVTGDFPENGPMLEDFDALATANDNGISFHVIAQYIRKNYEIL